MVQVRLKQFFGCLVLSLFLIVLSSIAFADNVVRINGTGAAISIIKKLADEFQKKHPSIRVEINMPVTGSGGGIRGVIAEALDIAVSARPLKASELQKGLIETPLAKTPFVFVVSEKNTQKIDLTKSTLAAIYSGKIKHWANGSRLRFILRPETDSDTVLVRSISPELDLAMTVAQSHKGTAMAMNDHVNADMIEKIDGALGGSLMSLLISENRPLRILSFEGINPSVENMSNGTYPLYKTFSLITRKATSSPARQFLDFLYSSKAKNLLSENGCQVF